MNFLTRYIRQATDGLSRLFVLLGGGIVIIMMLLISFATISRYAFGQAQGWVTEVSAYSILILAFLGAPEVLRKNKHVDIDLFVNMLSDKTRAGLGLFTSLVGMLLCLMLFWYGIVFTYESYREHAMLVGMVQIPKYYLLWIIPIGFLLLSIYFARLVKHKVQSLLLY